MHCAAVTGHKIEVTSEGFRLRGVRSIAGRVRSWEPHFSDNTTLFVIGPAALALTTTTGLFSIESA